MIGLRTFGVSAWTLIHFLLIEHEDKTVRTHLSEGKLAAEGRGGATPPGGCFKAEPEKSELQLEDVQGFFFSPRLEQIQLSWF